MIMKLNFMNDTIHKVSKTMAKYEILYKDIFESHDKLNECQGQALFDLLV